jgi:hypothetical protein
MFRIQLKLLGQLSFVKRTHTHISYLRSRLFKKLSNSSPSSSLFNDVPGWGFTATAADVSSW